MDEDLELRVNNVELTLRVIVLLCKMTGAGTCHIHSTTRIAQDLGVHGLDALELMEAFADEFDVDMTAFRFNSYFYPDGWRISWLFKPPLWMDQVEGNCITVNDLVEAAIAKKWTKRTTNQ